MGLTYQLATPILGAGPDSTGLSVALSNESKALLTAIVTALGTPAQVGGAVTVSGVATAAGQATANTSLASITGQTVGLALHSDIMALITALGTPAQAGAVTVGVVGTSRTGAATQTTLAAVLAALQRNAQQCPDRSRRGSSLPRRSLRPRVRRP